MTVLASYPVDFGNFNPDLVQSSVGARQIPIVLPPPPIGIYNGNLAYPSTFDVSSQMSSVRGIELDATLLPWDAIVRVEGSGQMFDVPAGSILQAPVYNRGANITLTHIANNRQIAAGPVPGMLFNVEVPFMRKRIFNPLKNAEQWIKPLQEGANFAGLVPGTWVCVSIGGNGVGSPRRYRFDVAIQDGSVGKTGNYGIGFGDNLANGPPSNPSIMLNNTVGYNFSWEMVGDWPPCPTTSIWIFSQSTNTTTDGYSFYDYSA